MATFRKYGGTNYSPIANIVRHNMFNSKSSSFITSGLYNSKETFLSHIDMSGNSLLHIGNLYFQDGTSISSGTSVNVPTLSQVLNKGNSANSNAILDLSYILFKDGSILNTATGITPTLATVLNNGNSAGDYPPSSSPSRTCDGSRPIASSACCPQCAPWSLESSASIRPTVCASAGSAARTNCSRSTTTWAAPSRASSDGAPPASSPTADSSRRSATTRR